MQRSTDNVTFTNVANPTATSAIITGLTNGTRYWFRVYAVNAAVTSIVNASTSGAPASNVVNAVPTSVAAAPTAFTATAANAAANLAWVAPVDTGGAAITSYRIERLDSGTWNLVANTSASPYAVTGLTNGTSYTYRVAAVNGAGIGAYTESVIVTPATVPTAPLSLARVGGDQFVTLNWLAPASSGGVAITAYIVEESPDGVVWTEDLRTSALEATVTGLVNGNSYRFRVRAVNAAGAGPNATTTAVIPSAQAAAPTSLAATPGNGTLALSWSAPFDTGGSTITGYSIERTVDGGLTWTAVRTVATAATTFTGLSNGTSYSFRVRAINAIGTGAASSFVTAAPYTTPGAPRSVTVAPADTQAVLTWVIPASTGGATITSYVVQQSTDNVNWTFADNPTTTTTTIADLTNGQTYSFRVFAVNAAVTDVNTVATSGAVASATVSTIPRTTASAPLNVVPTSGDRRVTLGWNTPTNNGGTAITGYLVQYSSTGGRTWINAATVSASTLTAAVTGLTNGVAYAFRIAALNAAGTGAASTWVTSSPVAPPVAPRSVEATASEETVAALQWTPPTDDGGAAVVGYKVQTSTDGGTTWTDTAQLGPNVFDAGVQTASMSTVIVTSSRVVTLGRGNVRYMLVDDAGLNNSTSLQVGGLAVGKTYLFRVAAYSLVGQSPWTDTSVRTGTVPTTPRNAGYTATTDSVALSWDAPTTPAGVSFTYRVERSTDGGKTWVEVTTTDKTSVTDGGLDADTAYSYRITAINASLEGEAVTVDARTKAVEKKAITPEPAPTPEPTPNPEKREEAVVPVPAVPARLSLSVDLGTNATTEASVARIAGTNLKAKSKVTVYLEARTGELAGSGSDVVLSTRTNKFGKFTASLDVAKNLPAGRYVLTLKATDMNGRTVTKTVRFVVRATDTTNDSGNDNTGNDNTSNEGGSDSGTTGGDSTTDDSSTTNDGSDQTVPTTVPNDVTDDTAAPDSNSSDVTTPAANSDSLSAVTVVIAAVVLVALVMAALGGLFTLVRRRREDDEEGVEEDEV